MYQNPELRRAVIMKSFIDHCIQAGDAFLSAEELYQVCLTNSPFLSIDDFHDDIPPMAQMPTPGTIARSPGSPAVL